MTFRVKGKWQLGLAALALVLAMPASGVRAGSNPDAQAALGRALKALKALQPRVARVELMNAIKADPTLAAARVAQARALLMLGNAVAARDELDMAARLGAAPSSYRHFQAQAALMMGKPDEALDYARSADIDPAEAVFAARIEGQAYQALGQFEAAAAALERARAGAPNDAGVWADIGRLNLATGDLADAHRAAERAVKLAPNSADALVLRAMLIREQYGLVASLPWFARVLERYPDDVPALMEFAATLADAGQAQAALSYSRKALNLSAGLPQAYFLQAVMAARAEQYDLARALLRRTHGALDGRPATRLLRGVLYLQSGDATLAGRELQPLLDAQPLNLKARLLLARAYYLDGLYEDAEHILFPLVERADADSYALSLAARINEALGRRDNAALFLRRANMPVRGAADVFKGAGSPGAVAAEALAHPGQAYANLRYIRALLEARQVDAALARATALRAANPGAPAAHLALGDCLIAAGRPADAAKAYEQAANIRFSEETAFRLVNAWQQAREWRKASDVLGLYLDQNPMSVDAQRMAAYLYLAAGDHDRAIGIYEGLLARLGAEDVRLMTELAYAWLGKGDTDEALKYAAHAYRLQPANPAGADVLGWALFSARGPVPQALSLLDKAARLNPAEPLVQLHLGLFHADAGNKAAARTALTKAARTPGFLRAGEAQAALRAL